MSTKHLSTADSGISLRTILPDAKTIGDHDLKVQSCCGLWRECQPNDVFVAIVGDDDDGHDFAQEAIERGAVAVVSERLLAVDRPQFLVDDSRKAFGKICQALAGNPADRVTTIGVSGSDGKTVTTRLIESILYAAGKSPRSTSSLTASSDCEIASTPSEQLNSPRLANWLAESVIQRCSHAVMEIHSRSLAQHCLTGVAFDVAVLTNLRNDHLDFHGTGENYRRVQARLLEYIKPEGVAIFNADDPNTARLLDGLDLPALTIGIHQSAELTAKLLERTASEQLFVLTAGSDSAVVRTQMIGKHHVYNCLSAAGVGLALGIDLQTIVRGLEDVGQVAGRLERVVCGQSFDLWIDSAARPNQLASAIHAVRQVTDGRVWVVASTSPNQRTAERNRIGQILDKAADYTVLTQSDSRPNTDSESAHQILDGYENQKKVRVVPNRFRAIEWILEQASEGDTVLITGLGDRPSAVIGRGEWGVTDRDVCQAWLYDRHSFATPLIDPRQQTFRIEDYRPE
jgi:UDP-N-acetylmuramoyl-L-alanyl-D-glutamate--2,6-diaminopimelate ligase